VPPFAFDGYVRAFGEGAGEIGEFPEGHAPMPLRARLPEPASFFQDVLVASEKIAILVASVAFLSASLPMKPIMVIRLRCIPFLVALPVCLGHRKVRRRR
jgi:hypothetical protein